MMYVLSIEEVVYEECLCTPKFVSNSVDKLMGHAEEVNSFERIDTNIGETMWESNWFEYNGHKCRYIIEAVSFID